MVLRIDLCGELSDPAVARRAVERSLRAYDHPGDLDTVLLLVSELVSNAVLHASPPITVNVDIHDGSVTLSVEDDDGHRLPAYRDPGAGAAGTGGYGLAIVDRLADEWGWRVRGDGGKIVWAEIPGDIGR
jgi:anti-sigma regulatory factor (Ser/Thr protein kinase)